jgi:hypothetical protein
MGHPYIALFNVLCIAAYVSAIGQPRKPLSAETLGYGVLINSVCAYSLWGTGPVASFYAVCLIVDIFHGIENL